MIEEITDFISTEKFINLISNVDIKGMYLGGSRYYGVNSKYSDFDLVIINSTFKKEFVVSLKESDNDPKIDLFFVPSIDLELNNKIFELVKLYTLLNPNPAFIIKEFDYDKSSIKPKIIKLLKKYFYQYLKNTEEEKYKKLDYHLCMVNMLLKSQIVDIDNIMELKTSKKRNEWSRQQFKELIQLIEEN